MISNKIEFVGKKNLLELYPIFDRQYNHDEHYEEILLAKKLLSEIISSPQWIMNF